MCNTSLPSSIFVRDRLPRRAYFAVVAILIGCPLGFVGAGAEELRSTWTRDAFAPSRGLLRDAASIPSVAGITPTLDAGALAQFREFRAGELPVERLGVSGGSWACLKLTTAAGRPANGCHFIEFDASALREISEAQELVSGLVLGPKATNSGDPAARETIKYLVPKAQEAWFLGEVARAKASTATVMRLETEAFARARPAGGRAVAGR